MQQAGFRINSMNTQAANETTNPLSQTLDEVFTLSNGNQLKIHPPNSYQMGQQNESDCSPVSGMLGYLNPVQNQGQNYVQDGLTNFWKQRLGNKNSSKSQGQSKRVRKKNTRTLPDDQKQVIREGEIVSKSTRPSYQRNYGLDRTTPQIVPHLKIQQHSTSPNNKTVSSLSPRSQILQSEYEKVVNEQQRQPPGTANFTSGASRDFKLNLAQTQRINGQKNWNNHSPRFPTQNSSRRKDSIQEQTATGKFAIGKRLIGTGAGGRRITGLGSLKDGSNVISAQGQRTQPGSPTSKMSALESQQTNPFVIKNMKLRDKFATPSELDDQYYYLTNIEQLSKTFAFNKQSQQQQPISIKYNTNAIIRQSQPSTIQAQDSAFHSLATIATLSKKVPRPQVQLKTLEQKNQEEYRKLILLTTGASNSNCSSAEQVGSLHPAGYHQGEDARVQQIKQQARAHVYQRVPPLNVNLLKPIHNQQVPLQNQIQTFQQSARESYSVRDPQKEGKVEVINSASAAFRNFVKEKTLYLKGLDPFASIRTQGKQAEGWQKLQLQSIHKKAPISRQRNSQKPSAAHVPLMNKNKRKKGAQKSRSPGKLFGSLLTPRDGSIDNSKRSSLKKPVLSTKQLAKGATKKSLAQQSIEQPAMQLSTATLFNDRTQTNASQVNKDVHLTQNLGKNNQNRSQHNGSSLPKNEKSETRNQKKLASRRQSMEIETLNKAKDVKTQPTLPHKKVSACDVLMQNSLMQSSVQADEETNNKVGSLHKMPSVSPTFKQLSEIFAFIDQQDYEGKISSNYFESLPIVQVQMTERSGHPEKVEVRKRKKTRIGTMPYQLVNRFDNSKLGISCLESGINAPKNVKTRRHSNNVELSQFAERKSVSMKPIVGDPNNLQNRFFSLRRQRERRHEAIVAIQKGQQQDMYFFEGWEQVNTPREATSPGKARNNITGKPLSQVAEGTNEDNGKMSPSGHTLSTNKTNLEKKLNTKVELGNRSRGGDTQLGDSSDVLAEHRAYKELGKELQHLIQQSLIGVDESNIQISSINQMIKEKYKSSQGINSTISGHVPIYEDVISFNQSCVASDTHDLGDLETLNPKAEYAVVHGSQSLIDDKDHEQFISLPYGGGGMNDGSINTYPQTPKVQITGVSAENFDVDTTTDQSKQLAFIKNKQQNQYQNANAYQRQSNHQQAMTPSQLWAYFKSQQASTEAAKNNLVEQPLIVQQEAQRRQQGFARIGKDGRMAFIGQENVSPRKGSILRDQQDRSILSARSNQVDQDQSTPLLVSQPWKTQQEQKASMEKAMQQLILEEQQRQQLQKNRPIVVHHHIAVNEDGSPQMIKMDPAGGILHSSRENFEERPITPNSPYDQFRPNTRNVINKPLLTDSGKATRWGNNPMTNLHTTTNKQGTNMILSPAEEAEKDPPNTVTDKVAKNQHADQLASTQNYFKVKVPVLSINQVMMRDSQDSKDPSGTTTKQNSPPAERRTIVNLSPRQGNTREGSPKTSIMHGSFRLKDQRGQSIPKSTFTTGGSLRINSAFQQHSIPATTSGSNNCNQMMIADIGRQDTLSIFNAPPSPGKAASKINFPSKDQQQTYPMNPKKKISDNIVIDTGEFTYSKLIIRDQNGIGKSPMIKELKYVPVCEKSMTKRRESQKVTEEWTRLGAAACEKSSPTLKNSTIQTQTVTPLPDNSPISGGHREMACMINEDIIDEMQRGSGFSGEAINNQYCGGISEKPSVEASKASSQNQQKHSALIKIQNQTLKQKQEIWGRGFTPNSGRGTPRDHVVNEGPNAQTVFRVPYPTNSQLAVSHVHASRQSATPPPITQQVFGNELQLNTAIQNVGPMMEIHQNQRDSRPPSQVTNGNTPRQSEMQNQDSILKKGSELVPKYD